MGSRGGRYLQRKDAKTQFIGGRRATTAGQTRDNSFKEADGVLEHQNEELTINPAETASLQSPGNPVLLLAAAAAAL